jgi:pilus assembly protein CpaC
MNEPSMNRTDPLHAVTSSPLVMLLPSAVAVGCLLALSTASAQTSAPAALQRAATTAPAPMVRAPGGPDRSVVPVYPTSPCGRVDVAPVVQVAVGKSTVIRPASPVSRILVGNPVGSRAARPTEKVPKDGKTPAGNKDEAEQDSKADPLRPGVADVDVLLLSPTEVYVLGRTIGATNVVLLDRSGACTAFDVNVQMDTGGLQTLVGQLMPQERDVRITSAYDSIVLTGMVSDPGSVTRLHDLAKAYVRSFNPESKLTGQNPRVINMLGVGAPQQVMLEVKVAEIAKSVLDKFGINFTRALVSGGKMQLLAGLFGGVGGIASSVGGIGADGRILGTVSGTVGSTGQAVGEFAGPVTYGPSGQIIPYLGRSASVLSVDAQKTDGLVKILAEPTVMAISGKKGSFLAGGKIFIPVGQDTSSGGTKITLEEKEFGVSVAFLPVVLDGGQIDLEVATEVSELNREGIGISVPGAAGLAVLPSFTSRRAKTTVQLVDGQSFAIGGLVKNNTTTNVRAFPGLGEIPILGALFRSTDFQTDRSELVFVITPRLVKPLPPDHGLPTDAYIPPSRSDLILWGRTEGQPGSPTQPKASPLTAPAAPGAPAPTPPAGGFQTR